MTLPELSVSYEAAAVPLRARLRELRNALAVSDDPEEIWHLKRRIAELTHRQRETRIAYYFQERTITQIAQERGVNKSTVCRTLHRAEQKLRRYLKY